MVLRNCFWMELDSQSSELHFRDVLKRLLFLVETLTVCNCCYFRTEPYQPMLQMYFPLMFMGLPKGPDVNPCFTILRGF